MTTEFHGEPVAGGTFPAMIWKTFMEKALKLPAVPGGQEVQYFPPAPALYGASERVVLREGKLERDNGRCRETSTVEFLPGRPLPRRADCKPNEVEVPRVVGDTVRLALQRLVAQPLTPSYVYKPAKPGQRLNVVLAQYPSHGTLSSYDRVMLVVPRALHGVVPDVVGLKLEPRALEAAQAAAERSRRPVRARQARARARAEAARRRRGGAQPPGAPHRGKGRLRKREPARP